MARGRARVAAGLADLTDLEPCDIIVCSTTDPSWVPLFLLAGGVVCDIGAPSSHAAIVSREIGVPFVVSVTRARDRIADGTPVEIDGLPARCESCKMPPDDRTTARRAVRLARMRAEFMPGKYYTHADDNRPTRTSGYVRLR